MDNKLSGWSSTADEKPAQRSQKRPAFWLASGLLVVAICVIGFVTPANLPLPKPVTGEGTLLFATELLIQKDGSLLVTENTRSNLQSKTARHGISRWFLTSYLDENKKEVAISFSSQRATIELLAQPPSQPKAAQVKRLSVDPKFVTYRIGDPETVLNPGTYDFIFQYMANGLVRRVNGDKSTGFVWKNVSGTIYPIGASQLRIKLPPFVDPGTIDFGVFLGLIEDTDSAMHATHVDTKSPEVAVSFDHSADEKDVYVTFKVKRPLKPLEHFIVRLAWPPGFLDGGL